MEEYKPNSHKYKNEQKVKEAKEKEEKKVSKVVTGNVKTKKKGEIRKLTDVFISEDVSNVKNYVLMDVLIPAIKKAVCDIVTDGISMILYGKTQGGKKHSSSYVSYRDFSRRPSETRSSSRDRFDYDELIFESRGDAEIVLDQMGELIERFGVVSVADLYDMADRTAPYTANRYGWTSLRTAEVIRVHDGYVIKLSRAVLID